MSPTTEPTRLAPQHQAKLDKSGVSAETIARRGYASVIVKSQLESLGFARSQCQVPALLIPIYGADGRIACHQIRPDDPRRGKDGRIVKYEVPKCSETVIDVPPLARDRVLDPAQPLFITEGAIKADAAVSRGAACVSIAGVWAWKSSDSFWKFAPLAWRRVYIVFDSDLATNDGVQKACVKLFKEFQQCGADPRVVVLPPAVDGSKQGLDDFLAGGRTLDELVELAQRAVPDVSKAEERDETGSYRTSPGGLVRVTWRKGEECVEPLANFTARITAQIEIVDGHETRYEFEITAELRTGTRVVTLPADEYAAMNWVVDLLGAEAVIHAGYTTRDHLRAAIQLLSGEIPRRLLCTQLGWTQRQGQWLFVHAGGTIGADPTRRAEQNPNAVGSPNPQLDQELQSPSPIGPIPHDEGSVGGLQVRVPEVLRDYRLPEPSSGDELIGDVRLVFDLLVELAPHCVTLPLLASVFRIAVDGVDFSLHLVGRTNVGKTELLALFVQFFGAELHRRNLPGSWLSTSNQLLATASYAKNVAFPVDDFVPQGTQSDIDRANRDADRLFRAQGNQAGRGRCNRDGTPRQGRAPRCLIVSTGEASPEGHSLNSRILALELKPGDLLCDDLQTLNDREREAAELKHKLLTLAQRAARQGCFARVMSAFLTWLASDYEETRAYMAEQKAEFRELFQKPRRLPRVVDIAADLLAGFEILLVFCGEKGAVDQPRWDKYWEAIHDALREALDRQDGEAAEAVPARHFVSLVQTALATGRAHLKNPSALESSVPCEDAEAWGWEKRLRIVNSTEGASATTETYFVPRGEQIGWVTSYAAFLDPAAALAVVQRLEQESSGRKLPLTQRMLGRRLHELGLLESRDADHFTMKIYANGGQKRVLHLLLSTFQERPRNNFPDPNDFDGLLA